MGILCKIVEKDEKLNTGIIIIGLPDEKGTLAEIAGVDDETLNSLVVGNQYKLNFTPIAKAAIPTETVELPPETAGPCESAIERPSETPVEVAAQPLMPSESVLATSEIPANLPLSNTSESSISSYALAPDTAAELPQTIESKAPAASLPTSTEEDEGDEGDDDENDKAWDDEY